MPMVSMTSSRVAPCLTAASAWKAMQPSHRVATELPSAISSLVLVESALGSSAARASPLNAVMTSGAPARSGFSAWTRSLATSGQLWVGLMLGSFRGGMGLCGRPAVIAQDDVDRRDHEDGEQGRGRQAEQQGDRKALEDRIEQDHAGADHRRRRGQD